jgi:hypothetical protein
MNPLQANHISKVTIQYIFTGQSHLNNPIQNTLEIGIVPTRFESLGMDANPRRFLLAQEIQRDVA